MNAASLNVAELYVAAFQNLAKTNNTLILPANCNDVSQMVAQAMTMYRTLAQTNEQGLKKLTRGENPGGHEAADSAFGEYYSDDEERRK